MSRSIALVALVVLALFGASAAMPLLRNGAPGPLPLSVQAGRDSLVASGKALYDNRAKEHYTEGTYACHAVVGRTFA